MNSAFFVIEGARFLALAGFAVASLWTPGPNNILLARSGARFGLRRSVPHMLGVAWGFSAMLCIVALGLGEVFRSQPVVREGLRAVGVAVILYMSWRIAFGAAQEVGSAEGRPFRFYEAVAFQWINPKAWVMSISAAAIFVTGAAPVRESIICAGVFALIGMTSSLGWAALGANIGRLLKTARHHRAFGVVMGLLLAISAVSMLFDDLATVAG